MLSTQHSAEPSLGDGLLCTMHPRQEARDDAANKSAHSSNNWRRAIEAAKCEADPLKLAALVKAAEDAIFLRWQSINGKNRRESEAMDRAVATLRELLVNKLNFPSWEFESKGEQAQFLPRRHFL
jgi:hypothetical protein